MRVRRKTPILEARQFTAESGPELVKDKWLSSVITTADGTIGVLMRSAGRTRDVEVGQWIVLEKIGTSVTGPIGSPITTPLPFFRAISAEQFKEDFECMDPAFKTTIPPSTLTGSGSIRTNADPYLESPDALIDTGDGAGAPPINTSSGEVAKAKK